MKELSRLTSQLVTCSMFIFLSMPASTNYQLKGYSFGGGGTDDSTSTNYRLNAVAGETSTTEVTSTNYSLGSGLNYVQQANVPVAPTFTNPASYYNKLDIIINESGNPSDATYAIALSDDSFTTTYWVQSDNTISLTLGIEDYQTYASWGGATGTTITGLKYSTTYEACVKAMQGRFTETKLGPCSSAATVGPTLVFDIDVSATDSETAAPYQIAMGDLTTGSVTTASDLIWVDYETNAETGGVVFVEGSSTGLTSTTAGSTITSVSGDLASLSSGFGIQGSSVAQTSGGPISFVSPYNGAAENVGITDTTIRELLTSSASVIGGRASFSVKAKSETLTPAGTDYSETLTFVAAGTY